MIYLYSDILTEAGGIETYLHALATKLHEEDIPFRVAVSEQQPREASCEMLDDLQRKGIDVYRQPYVPGDRWRVRKWFLMLWLWGQLEPGDWVYCVRQPIPDLYLNLVRLVHNRGAKIAASWMFAPEYLMPDSSYWDSFCQAIQETDAVISVSECTKHQFEEVYGYEGPVEVVRYHNLSLFDEPVALPKWPPWKIGFMGRLNVEQKNLDTLLHAFGQLEKSTPFPIELHFFGHGEEESVRQLADSLQIRDSTFLHGPYDHRNDLREIMEVCHLFVYISRYEGGPCFTLLELLQAGRYVVAAPVGGIPDIYAGQPDIGRLVNADEPGEIANALHQSIQDLRDGNTSPATVRSRYFEEFDMETAHEEWKDVILES